MPKDAVDRYGIAIKEIDGGMITAAKSRVKFLGLAKDYEILLGTPWKHAVKHEEKCFKDGSSEHVIYAADGSVGRFSYVTSQYSRFPMEKRQRGC